MFAENLAMKLIGLITTVVVLGAVYLFMIKPILDTTNNAFDSVNDSLDTAFDDFGVEDFNVDEIKNGNANDIKQQLQSSGLNSKDQQQAQKLLECIQRVQPDTTKMQACVERFG